MNTIPINCTISTIPQRNVEGLEQELKDIKMHRECQSETNVTIWKFIDKHKLELDVFKASQTEYNEKVLSLIKDIHKTLIIGFSVFVFFMLATWAYLAYTFFKH